ncbi:hypothetical protein CEXT_598791, partial [Caerostris extrusa]
MSAEFDAVQLENTFLQIREFNLKKSVKTATL